MILTSFFVKTLEISFDIEKIGEKWEIGIED